MKLDRYIFIEGPDQDDLIKALQQFANNYSDSGVTDGLELYKTKLKNNEYVVNVSEKMDIERFKYLVNYLNYPEDIKYQIDMRGYWTVTEADKIRNGHIGQRIMFYVSPHDTEYDNVFGIFNGGNQTIKFGFALGEAFEVQKRKERDFSEPELIAEDFEQIQTINADPSVKRIGGKGCLVTLMMLLFVAISFSFFLT